MGFLNVQGHECLSACFGCVLGDINPKITPNSIVLLGDGLDVSFAANTHILSTQMYNSNFEFLKKYEIDFCVLHARDKIEAEQVLQKTSWNHTPLIIKLNPEQLNYNRVFQQAQDSTHYICVLNSDTDKLDICDNYVPTRIPSHFVGKVDFKMIMDAWIDMQFEYISVKRCDLSNMSFDEDIINRIKKGLEKYINGGKTESVYYGKDAIIRLFKRIIDNKDDYSFERLSEINYQLRVYGFISLKYILFEQLNNMKIIEEGVYNPIISEWNKICMALLKCGVTKKSENYTALLERVNCITNKELQLYNEILGAL